MDVAIAECREGCKSVADAARDNDVPKTTLRYRLRGKIYQNVEVVRRTPSEVVIRSTTVYWKGLKFLLASFF